jgi:hypothetical protein
MSRFCNHSICDGCWKLFNGNRLPTRLQNAGISGCCYCGGVTNGGIFVRAEREKAAHCVCE